MAIVVNGTLWRIEYVSPDNSVLMRSDGSRTVGVTDNNDKTIYLSANLKGQFLWRVVCHELCHVYCFEYNMHFSLDVEEMLANFIADHGRDIIQTADKLFRELKISA